MVSVAEEFWKGSEWVFLAWDLSCGCSQKVTEAGIAGAKHPLPCLSPSLCLSQSLSLFFSLSCHRATPWGSSIWASSQHGGLSTVTLLKFPAPESHLQTLQCQCPCTLLLQASHKPAPVKGRGHRPHLSTGGVSQHAVEHRCNGRYCCGPLGKVQPATVVSLLLTQGPSHASVGNPSLPPTRHSDSIPGSFGP